jgi:hypothetical protein
MGRTVCTEPQCLYKGALNFPYLYGQVGYVLSHIMSFATKLVMISTVMFA